MTSHQPLSSTDILARLAGISSYTPAQEIKEEYKLPSSLSNMLNEELVNESDIPIHSFLLLNEYMSNKRLNFTDMEDIFNSVLQKINDLSDDTSNHLSNRTLVGMLKDITSQVIDIAHNKTMKRLKNFETKNGVLDKAENEIISSLKDDKDKEKLKEQFKWLKAFSIKFPFAQGTIWKLVSLMMKLSSSKVKSDIILKVIPTAEPVFSEDAFEEEMVNATFKGGTDMVLQSASTSLQYNFLKSPISEYIKNNSRVCEGIVKNIDEMSLRMLNDKIPDIGRLLLMIAKPNYKSKLNNGSSFGEALSYAKSKLGKDSVFRWNGGYYTTNEGGASIKDNLGKLSNSTIEQLQKLGDTAIKFDVGEKSPNELKEHQIDTPIMNDVLLLEGVFDKLTSQLKNTGEDITTKITFSKFSKAWYDAGSPRHPKKFSDFLVKFLIDKLGRKHSFELSKLVNNVMDSTEDSENKKSDNSNKDEPSKSSAKEKEETSSNSKESESAPVSSDNSKESSHVSSDNSKEETAADESKEKTSKTDLPRLGSQERKKLSGPEEKKRLGAPEEKTDDTAEEEPKDKPEEANVESRLAKFGIKNPKEFQLLRTIIQHGKDKKFPNDIWGNAKTRKLLSNVISKVFDNIGLSQSEYANESVKDIESLEKAILIEQQCKLAGIQSSFNSTVFFERLDKFLNQAEVALIDVE
jgi:hypothetical protein